MLGLGLSLTSVAVLGGGSSPASTPVEILWDGGDLMAWDDGDALAWD